MKTPHNTESLFSLACLTGDAGTLNSLIQKANDEKLKNFANEFLTMAENNSVDSVAAETLLFVLYSHVLSEKKFNPSLDYALAEKLFTRTWSIISAANKEQQTALHIAAQQNRTNMLKLFFPIKIILPGKNLKNMLNFIAVKDTQNKSAIDLALENKNTDFTKLLKRITTALKQLETRENILYHSCGRNNMSDPNYAELIQARQRIEDLTKNNGPLSVLV